MRRAELQWIVLLLIAAAAGAQTVRSVGKQTYVDPYKAASEFDPVILPEHGKVEYQIDQRRGKPMLVYRFDYDIKISGPGVFNVRWSQAGGEETQVECGPLNDDCYVVLRNNEFRLYNVDRNAPYAFRAQACIKREPARSKCSPWSEPAYYLPYGAATCKIGFVWRAADPNDKVCVIPSSRSRAAADNARGASAACAPGYAWREAFAGDHVCVTLATRDETRIENASNNAHRVIDQSYGPDTCKPGFVWREAGPADHVCVLPETKVFTQADNAQAAQRRVEGGDACKPGWVWREAFAGDRVCVIPRIRDIVHRDNLDAVWRKASGFQKGGACEDHRDAIDCVGCCYGAGTDRHSTRNEGATAGATRGASA